MANVIQNLVRHPRWRAVLLLVAVSAGFASLSACHSESAGGPVDTAKAIETPTMVVAAAPAPVYATLPGTIVSLKRAEISSRLTGYVRQVDVQAGDKVRAGQHLLSIDSRDVRGNLQQAQAGLNQAQAVYDDAETNYKRYSTLFPQGAISRMQLDAAEREYHTAQAQLASAQAALRMAQAEISYADVTAPFNGVVVEKLVDPGDLATPGKPLIIVEDEHTLEIQSYAPNDVYAALHSGEKLPFSIGTASYTGVLRSVVAAADAQTHTHLMRISIPDGSNFTSGLYVQVHVPVAQQEEVRIPVTALTERAGITGVFVVDHEGRAHFRLVRVGNTDGERVEIQSGLADGERIVLNPTAEIDNDSLIAVSGGAR